MIVVRPNQLHGLGALPDPLAVKVKIPAFGVSLSARDVLLLLCSSGKLNKTLCDLVRFKPAEACAQLVAKGEAWLTDAFNKVISDLVSRTMDLVSTGCTAKNWKDIVKQSFTVTLTDDGISVEFDFGAMIQSTICAAVNKSISLSFKPVVNMLVKNLKTACAKLGSEAAPAGASSGASGSYTAPLTTTASRDRTSFPGINTAPVVESNPEPKAVYSVQLAPKSKMDNAVLAWGAVGVALTGVTWFALSRR